MSEGETKGRCRSEMTAAYGARGFKPNDSDLVTADAIDRLAADVAVIKEAVCDGSVAEERDRFFAGWAAALNERDKLRAEVERLKAIVHSDAGHMAKILIENERLRAGPAAPQPAAPPAGWLTEEERRALSRAVHLLFSDDCDTPSAGTIQALLSRAGSPPVVEVPALGFLGDMTGREQGIVLAYRDALDAAGVAWKEKGRE